MQSQVIVDRRDMRIEIRSWLAGPGDDDDIDPAIGAVYSSSLDGHSRNPQTSWSLMTRALADTSALLFEEIVELLCVLYCVVTGENQDVPAVVYVIASALARAFRQENWTVIVLIFARDTKQRVLGNRNGNPKFIVPIDLGLRSLNS